MLLEFSDPPLTLDMDYWRQKPDEIYIVELDEPQVPDSDPITVGPFPKLYKETKETQSVDIKTKTTTEMLFCRKIVPGILAFCLIIFALVIFPWIFFTQVHGAVCQSTECHAASKLFKRTMDLHADPCQDFYQFACGNWNWTSLSYLDHTTLIRQRILETLRELTEKITETAPRSVVQMKIFYDSCTHNHDSMDNFESLQALIDNYIRPHETLGMTLGRIRRLTGQSYMMGLSVGPDFIDTRKNRIFINQPELAVPKQILLSKLGEEYAAVMFNSLTRVWHLVYKETSINEINDTVSQIFELETDLAEAMTDLDKSTKPEMFNLVSLNVLNELFAMRQALEDPELDNNNNYNNNNVTKTHLKLNWIEYVGTVFENVADITGETIVNVKDVQFIRRLAQVISKTSVTRLRNYLRWQLLYTFGNDFFQSRSSEMNPEARNKREIECIGLLDSLLPFALSYTFVQKEHEKRVIINEAESILKNIVASFQEIVTESSWMEPGTKAKAIKKAGKVRAFLGYPKWLPNSTILDKFYNGLIFKSTSFLDNVLVALKWTSEKNLLSYNDPVDLSWSAGDSPAEVDCFYDDELNAITIPLGFLQPPFVGMGLRALDYGALGFFIGHELTHGFDTEGRYSDEEGRLSQWWTQNTVDNFIEKTRCIEHQYDRFYVPEINATVNGEQTLKENIADNGGVHLSYKAYQLYVTKHGSENLTLPDLERFSTDQLLFLSFAQSWCSYVSHGTLQDMILTNEHSPSRYRVLGSLMNFDKFSDVWQCKNNSKMNPPNKCILW